MTITADHLRDLLAADAARESGDAYRLVLAIGADGDLIIIARGDADGRRIVTDADAVEAYVGGLDDAYAPGLLASLAAELTGKIAAGQ